MPERRWPCGLPWNNAVQSDSPRGCAIGKRGRLPRKGRPQGSRKSRRKADSGIRPCGWHAEQTYVVVRRTTKGGQRPLIPHHTVILVSHGDLPLDELVRRHRGKQGAHPSGRLENTFKGRLVDMGLHYPPCRGYRANQRFHALGQIARRCSGRCSSPRC